MSKAMDAIEIHIGAAKERLISIVDLMSGHADGGPDDLAALFFDAHDNLTRAEDHLKRLQKPLIKEATQALIDSLRSQVREKLIMALGGVHNS